MGALSPAHWLIILGVLVVLFGAKRLPEAARSLGRSSRILKAELKANKDDEPGVDHDDGSPSTSPVASDTASPTTAPGTHSSAQVRDAVAARGESAVDAQLTRDR